MGCGVTVVACNLLLLDQRNSVWVGIGGGGRRGLRESDGDAHWIGAGSDGCVIVDAGRVQRVEEINQPVVYVFF